MGVRSCTSGETEFAPSAAAQGTAEGRDCESREALRPARQGQRQRLRGRVAGGARRRAALPPRHPLTPTFDVDEEDDELPFTIL